VKILISLFCVAGDRAGEGLVCSNIAKAYKQQQNKASAIEYMKRAHETFQSCYGAEHPKTMNAQRQVEKWQ
jgi:hypothetical protein